MPVLKDFAVEIPRTVDVGRRILGTNVDRFSRWACCPACSSIYPVNECKTRLRNGRQTSQKRTFVKFPGHPQIWRRKECGTVLMKTIKTSAGTISLAPVQTYCCRSIKASLEELVQHSDFIELCERWRNRNIEPGMLKDVYDGSIWNDFMDYEGVPFLSTPFNFALSLNVDWFQPFKHTQHSIGVLYVAIIKSTKRSSLFG